MGKGAAVVGGRRLAMGSGFLRPHRNEHFFPGAVYVLSCVRGRLRGEYSMSVV